MQELALFFYCIGGPDCLEQHKINGIDNNYEIFTVNYKSLYAYVSFVRLDEYGEGAIEAKLDDLTWLTEKAGRYMEILNEINRCVTVIPFKFCTIFKSEDRVKEILEESYELWQRNLSALLGKQEWSLKIYCDMPGFMADQMEKEKEEIERKLAGKPKGAAFFLRKKMEDSMNEKCQNIAMNLSNRIFEAARAVAAAYKVNKLLAKELTGKNEQMMINSALLIDSEKVPGYLEFIEDLNRKYKTEHFIIENTGPWPLYNFIDTAP